MHLVADRISTRSIMRLLVLSYFIALSLDLIGGTRMMDFMVPVLPPELADWLMRGLVLMLSLLILIGIGRRHAALVLSLIVFFSSYTSLYAGGDISHFWRDLALIGALLLTAELAPATNPADLWPERDNTEPHSPLPRETVDARPAPLGDQPFREDLDIVRAS